MQPVIPFLARNLARPPHAAVHSLEPVTPPPHDIWRTKTCAGRSSSPHVLRRPPPLRLIRSRPRSSSSRPPPTPRRVFLFLFPGAERQRQHKSRPPATSPRAPAPLFRQPGTRAPREDPPHPLHSRPQEGTKLLAGRMASGGGDDDAGEKRVADRYLKREVLGEGTYGVVFKAIDTKQRKSRLASHHA